MLSCRIGAAKSGRRIAFKQLCEESYTMHNSIPEITETVYSNMVIYCQNSAHILNTMDVVDSVQRYFHPVSVL